MTDEPKAELIPAISTEALEAVERANIDTAIATAKKFPMHSGAGGLVRFQDEATALATLSPEVAASCLYAVPRAGKMIEGKSARLAEICLSAWGNARCASRIIEIGEEAVTVQGVCHDLERNISITADVRRPIVTKHGKRYSADMINTATMAASSIARRNAILGVIPGALTEVIYQTARRAAVGDVDSLDVRRAKAMRYFALIGVTEERVLAVLGKPNVQAIDADGLATLLAAANSIKEKHVTPEEAFPELIDPSVAGLAAELKAKAKPEAPPLVVTPDAPPEEPEPEKPPKRKTKKQQEEEDKAAILAEEAALGMGGKTLLEATATALDKKAQQEAGGRGTR